MGFLFRVCPKGYYKGKGYHKGLNMGALIIRIGLWGTLSFSCLGELQGVPLLIFQTAILPYGLPVAPVTCCVRSDARIWLGFNL